MSPSPAPFCSVRASRRPLPSAPTHVAPCGADILSVCAKPHPSPSRCVVQTTPVDSYRAVHPRTNTLWFVTSPCGTLDQVFVLLTQTRRCVWAGLLSRVCLTHTHACARGTEALTCGHGPAGLGPDAAFRRDAGPAGSGPHLPGKALGRQPRGVPGCDQACLHPAVLDVGGVRVLNTIYAFFSHWLSRLLTPCSRLSGTTRVSRPSWVRTDRLTQTTFRYLHMLVFVNN